MFSRSSNNQSIPLNMVGSSVFGRHPKIGYEHTFNMFATDNFMVPYPGYKIGLPASSFGNAVTARGLYSSDKLDKIVAVFDNRVYLVELTYQQSSETIITSNIIQVGTLQTSTGKVYISENNKPQILISDGVALYVYDPSLLQFSVSFTASNSAGKLELTLALSHTLGLGEAIVFSGSGTLPTGLTASVIYYAIPIDSTHIEVAVSRADAISGTAITYTDVGTPPFILSTVGPFQSPTLNFTPGYITFHDTYFICAARNDATYSPVANNTWRLSLQNDGLGWPVTQDGVSYVGTLETKPDNTQAVVRFPSRGNMIFVMGNDVTEPWFDTGAQLFPYQRSISMNIDYGCISPGTVTYLDELVVWLAKNEKSGPIIMASTGDNPEKITTDGIDYKFSQLQNPQDSEAFLYRQDGHIIYHINFYTDNQSYFYDFSTKKIYQASDQGGNYYAMSQVVFYRNQYFSISKDRGNFFIFDTTFYTYHNTNADNVPTTYEIPRYRICRNIRLPTQDYFKITDIGFTIESGEIPNQSLPNETYAKVDLSISYDGGATFANAVTQYLPGQAHRRNKLQWWQLGLANDAVCQFNFWGFGRFVITDGICNITQ